MTGDPQEESQNHNKIAASIAGLSTVHLVTQVMAAGAQFLLAIWLLPADFGFWATATAWTALLLGLANFGEVNGYLSDPHARLGNSVRRTLIPNAVLLGVALGMSALAAYQGQQTLAWLLLICGVNIPAQGLGNLLYAGMVKHRFRRKLVLAQVASAIARILVMLVIAMATGSALALAAGLLVMSASLVVMCSWALKDRTELQEGSVTPRKPLLWGGQSLSQMLALQADYLVLSILANPVVLGLYFFSYQVTVAMTAVVSPALSRTAMAEFARATSQPARLRLAVGLQQRLGLVSSLLTLLAATLIVVAAPLLPSAWSSARDLILVLLLSIPARLANPLTDALQMASGRWRRSSLYNLIDAIGTAAAATSLIVWDIFWVALAIAIWKAVWSGFRIFLAFGVAGGRRTAAAVAFAPVAFAVVAAGGMLLHAVNLWPFVGGVVAMLIVYSVASMASRFRDRN